MALYSRLRQLADLANRFTKRQPDLCGRTYQKSFMMMPTDRNTILRRFWPIPSSFLVGEMIHCPEMAHGMSVNAPKQTDSSSVALPVSKLLHPSNLFLRMISLLVLMIYPSKLFECNKNATWVAFLSVFYLTSFLFKEVFSLVSR